MTSNALKKQLHKAIDGTSDTGFLKAVYAMFNEYSPDFSSEYKLSAAEKEVLDEQKKLHKSGKTRSFSVSEVRKMATSKSKK